jgi:hypothetical protein
MDKIIMESLFTAGGTLNPEDIIKTPYGYIAANREYIFLSDGRKCAKIKYKEYSEYVAKPGKNKIYIYTIDSFLNKMKDDLFYFVQRGLFAYYL